MVNRILQAFHRKKQLSLISRHPKSSVGDIKIGNNNHFTIYKNIKKLHIGSHVNFRNYIHIILQDNASLIIEDNVFMNNFCSINCLDKISIGENTLFGENVKLYDHNHSYQRTENGLAVEHQKFETAPITIGKNCWLGSNVTVLKGVTIGDNCIIGAGCTIYKDIPDNSTIVNQQNLLQL